ncbi:ead/Ea22-like family protein [Pseudomonas sp. NBRC 111127]|uniref:ead/Ea22-like family protein n=1 Tax=Pseudomonas sp. NBRC 111127 TaxID=1661042 RepID=UPI0006D41C98|nr:ead/Ea22-like family protein [Pseudomonas sp. NBRC 111127]
MNIDRAKLRALAQAATGGQWVTEGEHINQHGHLLHVYVAHENSGMIAQAFANCRVKTDAECRANAAFIASANPANILALLAEIERLHEHKQHLVDLREAHGFDCWAAALVEIDRVRAANEALSSANDARRRHLDNAKLAAGVGPFDDLVTTVEALRQDAQRYRWLKLQRSRAWKEAADVPMNHTDAHIDAAMAAEADVTDRRDNQNLTNQEE